MSVQGTAKLWIKYTKCKKCGENYNDEIRKDPCIRCGYRGFEQVDLILY